MVLLPLLDQSHLMIIKFQNQNLQIVNGGQTTALFYAKIKKADLTNVHVQMKLSVVDE